MEHPKPRSGTGWHLFSLRNTTGHSQLQEVKRTMMGYGGGHPQPQGWQWGHRGTSVAGRGTRGHLQHNPRTRARRGATAGTQTMLPAPSTATTGPAAPAPRGPRYRRGDRRTGLSAAGRFGEPSSPRRGVPHRPSGPALPGGGSGGGSAAAGGGGGDPGHVGQVTAVTCGRCAAMCAGGAGPRCPRGAGPGLPHAAASRGGRGGRAGPGMGGSGRA